MEYKGKENKVITEKRCSIGNNGQWACGTT
jgi:hypothetical protein